MSLPLYAYRCTACGHKFEKIQSFSSDPELVCPKCGGRLERPLTAPGLSFKGAGWYVNDYAPKAASSAPSNEGAAEATPAKPVETPTPAATTDSAPKSGTADPKA